MARSPAMFHHPGSMQRLVGRRSSRFGSTAVRVLAAVVAWSLALLVVAGTSAPRASAAVAETLWKAGIRDAAAGLPGRWERELSRRQRLLRRHGGRNPAAILGLLGLLAELEGEIADDRIVTLLRRVEDDRRRHPAVRSYASYLHARLLEHAGRIDDARARYEGEGYLLRWRMIGPFDNAGRKGHDTRYAPEREPFEETQRFVGKLPGEQLGWRVYDYGSLPRGGYVSFDDVLRPTEQVTAYATTWIRVAERTDAVLHLGTGGAYRAWIDGVEVGEGTAYRIPHPLQDAHAVRLEPGWHRVLLKVGALEGMWGAHVRLSTRGGGAIADLQQRSEPPEPKASGSGDATPTATSLPARPGDSLRGLLERAYERRERVAAGLDLVELYRHLHPFDVGDRSAVDLARELDDRARTGRSAWLVASIDPDQNRSRRALMDGIARARAEGAAGRPRLARMLLELAWRYQSLGLERRARALAADAREAAPDDAIVELDAIERLASDGFTRLALQWIEDVVRRYPESTTVRHEYVGRLLGEGYTERALAELERLARHRRTSHGLTGQRIEALLRLGRADEAVEVARWLTDAMPGLPGAHARLAYLEEARGNEAGARAALARAIALAPQDAELHGRLGRMLARNGDAAGAVASLRRSLELKPQQPGIRDLLASFEKGRTDDLFARHVVELEQVAKRKTPKAWAGKSAGVLHNLVAVRVHPNGLSERLEHRIIRILDDRGVRGQFSQGIQYDPAESMVEVRRARVRRADGSIENLGETHVYSLAQAGFRMFYDQREKQVQFTGLRVGDVLEVAFVKRDVAARNMFDQYFGDLVPLQGMEPRLHTEYVLEAPADMRLHFNVDVERTRSRDGATRTYRHVAKSVPGIKPEAKMPGWTEVAKYLHVSTYANWDDVGRWYWDLVREQLVVDARIREGVKQAISRLPPNATERDRIRSIYEHVVRNTRYVGLEFGIHGYKPYRTADVYERRFGDCKDKASLLKVMLAEVGVDSHLVLVRTRDRGAVSSKPASLAAFNHAIVYVPSHDLYLDGTAEWSGPEELPANDQGATVLLVKDGAGAELRTIPMSTAAANARNTTQQVRIRTDGGASVDHEVVVSGADAAALRYAFQSEERRSERMASAWGSTFPGTKVEAVGAPGIVDILRPVNITARVDVPVWSKAEGERLRFRVLGRTSTMVQTLAPQAKRHHDLVLEVPGVERHDLRYRLPAGMRFADVPRGRELETPFGRFSLEVETTGNEARVRTRLEILAHRIGVGDYPRFREFLREVDATLEQTFEVERAR